MRLLCASVSVRVVYVEDRLFFRDPNSDPAGTRCQAAARWEPRAKTTNCQAVKNRGPVAGPKLHSRFDFLKP